HHVDVRHVEGQIVVPTVPQQHVALGLRLLEDVAVVDTGVDAAAQCCVGLVLLALLDRGIEAVEAPERRVALHPLCLEVPVRHRMPNRHDALPGALERLGDRARRLALARTRPHGADGDDRNGGRQHRLARAEQHEVGAGRERLAGLVHHVLVAHVRVAEDDVVDALVLDQLRELALVVDRDPVRVALAGEAGWIPPIVDERDLCRGEGDDLVAAVAAVSDVEVVEVAPGGSPDEDTTRHGRGPFRGSEGLIRGSTSPARARREPSEARSSGTNLPGTAGFRHQPLCDGSSTHPDAPTRPNGRAKWLTATIQPSARACTTRRTRDRHASSASTSWFEGWSGLEIWIGVCRRSPVNSIDRSPSWSTAARWPGV